MKKYDIMILSGGFDPPHVGHVRMIKAATEMADVVFVGCNSDEWLIRKKGKNFMSHIDRSEILNAFSDVHAVIEFNDSDDTAVDLVRKVRTLYNPKLFRIAFGNGGDRTDENTPEQNYCEDNHIHLEFGLGGTKVRSSSELIKSFNGD